MFKLPWFSYRNRPESELIGALGQKIRARRILFWFGIIVMVGSLPFMFVADLFAGLAFLLGLYSFLHAETIEVFRDFLERKGHLEEILNAPRPRTHKTLWFLMGIALVVGYLVSRALSSST